MENLVTLTCPNCGAAATNHKNCEFCGSLLVRFVDKGIELAQTNYTNDLIMLPGLLNALQQNIGIQKENPNLMVVTDVYKEVSLGQKYIGKSSVLASVLKHLATQDGKQFFPEIDINDGEQHLMVAFVFDRHGGIAQTQAHDRFKKLKSFELFTCRKKGSVYEYAIDFGEDAEGAARILSEAIHAVHKINYGTQLDYKTYFGDTDTVERERKDDKPWYEKHWGWLVAGVFVIIWLIRMLADL